MAEKNESLLYLPPMLPTRDTFRNIISHSESFLANDVFVPRGVRRRAALLLSIWS